MKKIKPETWEKILGEEWTRENIRKEERPSPRKYGGSLTLVGSLTGTSMGRDPNEDADLLGVTLERRDMGKEGGKFQEGSGGGDEGQQGTLTFAECARDRLLLLERKRAKGKSSRHGGEGVATNAPEGPQPLGSTGVYNEVHTHAERKEEAMKRKAGEARSRQRRQKRQQEEQAAKRGESPMDQKGQGADQSKAGLSRRARLKQERDEKALSHRPARPLLVRDGGHGASALSDEPSPAVDAVVGGLRRRTGIRGRQRIGGALLGNRKRGGEERSGEGGVGSEG